MHRDGSGGFVYLLEEKSECRTNQANQHAETKSVDIAEERTLLLKDAVENRGAASIEIRTLSWSSAGWETVLSSMTSEGSP